MREFDNRIKNIQSSSQTATDNREKIGVKKLMVAAMVMMKCKKLREARGSFLNKTELLLHLANELQWDSQGAFALSSGLGTIHTYALDVPLHTK